MTAPSSESIIWTWLKQARLDCIRRAEDAERRRARLSNPDTDYGDAMDTIAKAHRKAAEVYAFIEREKIIPDDPVNLGDPAEGKPTSMPKPVEPNYL